MRIGFAGVDEVTKRLTLAVASWAVGAALRPDPDMPSAQIAV